MVSIPNCCFLLLHAACNQPELYKKAFLITGNYALNFQPLTANKEWQLHRIAAIPLFLIRNCFRLKTPPTSHRFYFRFPVEKYIVKNFYPSGTTWLNIRRLTIAGFYNPSILKQFPADFEIFGILKIVFVMNLHFVVFSIYQFGRNILIKLFYQSLTGLTWRLEQKRSEQILC